MSGPPDDDHTVMQHRSMFVALHFPIESNPFYTAARPQRTLCGVILR
jgi:hypothetical protein